MVAYVFLIAISFALIGYLFGSVLFGTIIAKFTKINLRKTGSQNVGGTNVSRALGRPLGVLVSLLDGAKAYLSIIVSWIIFYYSINDWFTNSERFYPIVYATGIFAVLGHCWPIQYLIRLFTTRFNFKEAKLKSGGKGVACTGGTLFAISPWLGLIAFGTFVIILLFFRYVSLGSIICMFLPTFMIFIPGIDYLYLFDHSLLFKDSYKPDWVTHVYLLCIMLCNSFLVIVRHVPNIRRLINHEERKIF